jgi:hypothetical protein
MHHLAVTFGRWPFNKVTKERSVRQSHYYVVFDGAGWTIQCDGENSEPYPHRDAAFRDAVALAHLDDRNGCEARVIVQRDGDMFRREWISSEDSYPPPLVPKS